MADEINPERDSRGMPFCAESCLQYDGKRCRALGFTVRLGTICEPAVLDLLAERDQAVADMEAAEQRLLGVLDGTFAVGDGTAQREIERLREQLAIMTAERDALRDKLRAALERNLALIAEYRSHLALVQRTLDETRRERDRAEAELARLKGER